MADTRTSSVLAAPTLLLFREAMVATAVSLAAVATVDRHGHRTVRRSSRSCSDDAARPVPARLTSCLCVLSRVLWGYWYICKLESAMPRTWSSGLVAKDSLGGTAGLLPAKFVRTRGGESSCAAPTLC